jgi:hypothetical protein
VQVVGLRTVVFSSAELNQGAGPILPISMPGKLKVLYKFSPKIQRKFASGNAIRQQSCCRSAIQGFLARKKYKPNLFSDPFQLSKDQRDSAFA